MNIPRGRLVRSRVVTDPSTPLSTALDRELTGYLRLEPQETLLLATGEAGVITFEAGVPYLAYSSRTDCGGVDALGDLAMPGPYATEMYELPPDDLEAAHDADTFRVPPGMPAERLAGDADLAARTRAVAPETSLDVDDRSPLESFLADEQKIDAIRERARKQAQSRAEEWGLADELE